jgi:hypothetical protein
LAQNLGLGRGKNKDFGRFAGAAEAPMRGANVLRRAAFGFPPR